jgi:endonuclease/exonuclease/phosphatase family metal-dependent hydrolase
MIKQLKQFSVNMVAGANVATIAVMLLCGYSDHISPENHPLIACSGLFFPFFLLLNLAFLLFWLIFKWTRAWIPVAGYLAAYTPIATYMPLNPPQNVPDSCIKVVSYNVCTYGGNYKYKDAFERCLDYFSQQKADIVCVQEDVDTWRHYVMQKYEEIFPYNDTTVFTCSKKLFNAVGIHTRYPILRKERIEYPSLGNGSVAYYLKRGNDTLLVINNHLESTHLTKKDRQRYEGILHVKIKGDTARSESMMIIGKLGKYAAKRAMQAETVHRYIEQHRQYPTIVCADLNDTPVSYARRTMAEGLTDCFLETGRGIGLSYNQKGFWVRIDHIFCSSHFTPYNCEIDSKVDFSDHYPIVCSLKLGDNP